MGDSVCGPLSDEQQADQIVNDVVTCMRAAIETSLCKSFQCFQPVSFKTQAVCGQNFFIKIQADCNEYIHVRIFQPCQGPLELQAIQSGLTLATPIDWFDADTNIVCPPNPASMCPGPPTDTNGAGAGADDGGANGGDDGGAAAGGGDDGVNPNVNGN